nr:hypothetical protein [Sphingosinicella sp. CPCC 101087]
MQEQADSGGDDQRDVQRQSRSGECGDVERCGEEEADGRDAGIPAKVSPSEPVREPAADQQAAAHRDEGDETVDHSGQGEWESVDAHEIDAEELAEPVQPEAGERSAGKDVAEDRIGEDLTRDMAQRRNLVGLLSLGMAAWGLAQRQEDEQGDQHARRAHDDECPAPADRLGDHAARHGADERAERDAEHHDRGREGAAVALEMIAEQ